MTRDEVYDNFVTEVLKYKFQALEELDDFDYYQKYKNKDEYIEWLEDQLLEINNHS